jgi:hypothetical protein
MKKLLCILFCMGILSTFYVSAQDFEPALAATLAQFETDSTPNLMAATVNRLELIAGKWNDQWLAHYFAAYGESVYSYIEKDEKMRDAILDKADSHLQQAEQLYGSENDEIYVLRALAASARLSVKPGDRWKKYGEIFNQEITKAKTINPANPRIYYLQGNSMYYTPKMFGGGPKNAMPYYEEADSLYQQMPVDSSSINPSWGKTQNALMLEKCRLDLKTE